MSFKPTASVSNEAEHEYAGGQADRENPEQERESQNGAAAQALAANGAGDGDNGGGGADGAGSDSSAGGAAGAGGTGNGAGDDGNGTQGLQFGLGGYSLSGPPIQAKLRVSQSDDPQEREADQVANAIVSGGPVAKPGQAQPAITPRPGAGQVLRRAAGPAAIAKSGGEVGGASEARIRGLSGGGSPLPETERSFFESKMGHDFGGVRVHNGAEAASATSSINARAFTRGNDIAFAPGQYQPESIEGRKLLAHELTHVVQQGGAGAASSAGQANVNGGASTISRKVDGDVVQREPDGDDAAGDNATGDSDSQAGDGAVGANHELLVEQLSALIQAHGEQSTEVRSFLSELDPETAKTIQKAATERAAQGGVDAQSVGPDALDASAPPSDQATQAEPGSSNLTSAASRKTTPDKIKPAQAGFSFDEDKRAKGFGKPRRSTASGAVASAIGAAVGSARAGFGGLATAAKAGLKKRAAADAGKKTQPAKANTPAKPAKDQDTGQKLRTDAPDTQELDAGNDPTAARRAPGDAGPPPADGAAGGNDGAPPAVPGANAGAGAGAGAPAGAGGAGGGQETPAASNVPQIEAASPGQVIEGLAAVPPVQAAAAQSAARAAAERTLNEQTKKEQTDLPEMPAPTGMAGGSQPTSTKVDLTRSNAPASFRGKKAGGAVPPVRTTRIPEDGRNVPVNPGAAPGVPLTGAADPSQVDAFAADAKSRVGRAKQKEQAKTETDFGEDRIQPREDDSILKANTELSSPASPGGKNLSASSVRADTVGPLNQSMGPEYRKKVAQERKKESAADAQLKRKKEQASRERETKISGLEQETRSRQSAEQKKAQSEVARHRTQWRKEIDQADSQYRREANQATAGQRRQIAAKKAAGDRETARIYADASKQATEKKKDATKEVAAKQKAGQNKGFVAGLADAARSVVNALRTAVNFIFDNLRKAVKFIFEKAKQLAVAAIEKVRRDIVGLISLFGEALKAIVNKVFAAFPGIAKRFNALIDGAVSAATTAVNALAEGLKKAVSFVLDAYAKIIDTILAAYQAVYNLILDAVDKIIEIVADILIRIGYLIEAAGKMPDFFFGGLTEAVLGQDLTEPLPFERTGPAPRQNVPAGNTPNDPGLSPKSEVQQFAQKGTYSDSDFAVEPVQTIQLHPELQQTLAGLPDGQTIEFGQSDDPSRTIPGLIAEQGGQAPGAAGDALSPAGDQVPAANNANAQAPTSKTTGEPAAKSGDSCEQFLEDSLNQKEDTQGKQKETSKASAAQIPEHLKPDCRLTPGQRASFLAKQLLNAARDWLAKNWPFLLAGVVAGIAAFIGLNILTGGAISAALPPLLKIMAAFFLGAALVRIGRNLGGYLSEGWVGNIVASAKFLAKALAEGLFELLSALLFNAGRVTKILKSGVRGGVKGVARASIRAARNSVRATGIQLLRSGRRLRGSPLIRSGRAVFQGLGRNALRGVRSMRALGRRLQRRFRLRKFRIRMEGIRFWIEGFINPWVLLATGRVRFVEADKIARRRGRKGHLTVGERVRVGGNDGIVVGDLPAGVGKVADRARIKARLNALNKATKPLNQRERFQRIFNRLNKQGEIKTRKELISNDSVKIPEGASADEVVRMLKLDESRTAFKPYEGMLQSVFGKSKSDKLIREFVEDLARKNKLAGKDFGEMRRSLKADLDAKVLDDLFKKHPAQADNHREFLEILKKLDKGPGDKGRFAESWYARLKETTRGPARRAFAISKADYPFLKTRTRRIIDRIQDSTIQDLKAVAGKVDEVQLDDYLAMLGKRLKGTNITVQKVKYTFLDPKGARPNKALMLKKLKKFPKQIEFEIFDTKGRRHLVDSVAKLERLLP